MGTGTGSDWVSYADSPGGVVVSLTTPADNKGWATDDTLTNINNLIGTNQADTLTGNTNANTLRGGAGNDTLTGNTNANTLIGGAGNDTFYGGAGEDTFLFYVGDGTDVLLSSGDGAGNKLVFRPAGRTYDNENFAFDRGSVDGTTFVFTPNDAGEDLQIIVKTGGTNTRNTVYIDGYYGLANNAYTIYHTSADADNEITTAPPETS